MLIIEECNPKLWHVFGPQSWSWLLRVEELKYLISKRSNFSDIFYGRPLISEYFHYELLRVEELKYTINKPFQLWAALGERVVCRFPFWLRPLRWAPSPGKLLWEHVSQLQSHWRRCWRSRLHLQLIYRWASDHQVGYHAPNNRVPSRRYRFGRQLVQGG